MSTRANIIITDANNDRLIFYRHSDGYPKGTLPTLFEFLDYIKKGLIRDNVVQASGWLILIGHKEYACEDNQPLDLFPKTKQFSGWKVGAYEPTVEIHGDIEHCYLIDLDKREIKHTSLNLDMPIDNLIAHLKSQKPASKP